MKDIYFSLEKNFEALVALATKVLGNSITFILACCLVLFWWINTLLNSTNLHQNIGDFIFGTTFLSLFIIQKSFNKYSALLHLKVNELISSHETANNSVIDTHKKTEHEIIELSKEYIETDEVTEEIIEELTNKMNEANTDNQI
ncbi:low affinity iron permease family protein [Flavobacterium sp. F372]|uniref:Low affinity iron permease family protein n=1 Tax=Flavobacterium bernardetii TaxID=2813823 RepID=A0ABR7IVK4_9FLAO|nr:low affinity iron permease family protein [Flavobacterium bernardetii]MBC5833820.1 low affinity iron permease family protein [Flavobacterium bernardetii]NHF69053.1 low affinity iron permease family protein [Flavobacterium bernardetii]